MVLGPRNLLKEWSIKELALLSQMLDNLKMYSTVCDDEEKKNTF